MRRVDQPVLAVSGVGRRHPIEDDKVPGQQEHQLPSCQAALLRQFRLALAADGAVLIAGRRVARDVDEIVVRLKRPEDGAELPVLAAVIALDRSAPVRRDRFARLMDDHAVVGHGLRIVVGQMLPVGELLVPRAGIQGQETAMVDDEVQGVVVAVLAEDAAAGEQAIGVVRARCPSAGTPAPSSRNAARGADRWAAAVPETRSRSDSRNG